jgi:hypothetical protein
MLASTVGKWGGIFKEEGGDAGFAKKKKKKKKKKAETPKRTTPTRVVNGNGYGMWPFFLIPRHHHFH